MSVCERVASVCVKKSYKQHKPRKARGSMENNIAQERAVERGDSGGQQLAELQPMARAHRWLVDFLLPALCRQPHGLAHFPVLCVRLDVVVPRMW